jgi:hypothetical protein
VAKAPAAPPPKSAPANTLMPHDEMAQLPSEFLDVIAQDGSTGISKKAEDNVLPLVRLLQQNSPQAGKRNAAYVDDAEPGDFYFRNAEAEITKGEDGFVFWPLGRHRAWVEWKPNRGGYAGQHLDVPPDAQERIDIDPENGRERKVLGLPSGNYLEETIYWYGHVSGSLWVIPFSSSGLGVARAFNSALNNLRIKVPLPKGGFEYRPIPLWASVWRFTSVITSNKEHEWFTYKFALLSKIGDKATDERPALMTMDHYQQGKALYTDLASEISAGSTRFEAPTEDMGGGPGQSAPSGNGTAPSGPREQDDDIPF